ncbi:hypothetical protein F5B20DRAFT_14758 [Whalleya microplaca]|nr:hypothetical protein F5B20DRAFT_14758 [Whalleya microplaca]
MAADNRGPELATITLLFLGLSVVTVALRCYVRICLLKSFRLEDWLALGTLMSFIFVSTCIMISIKYGAGRHLDDVPVENIPQALKMRWAGELGYVVTCLLLKYTVGIFLLRICSRTWQVSNRTILLPLYKCVIWAVLLVCLVFSLFYFFMAALQCVPTRYFWLRYTGTVSGRCLDKDLITGSTYAAAAINAVADWVLGLLPIALVWNLDLGKRAKISVACILALGSIASTATILRIPYVWQLTHDADYLYEFTDLAIWSQVENGLGLTASSIATLRPLFRHLLAGGTITHIHSPTSPPPSPYRDSYPYSRSPSWRKSGSGPLVIHCRGPSESSVQCYDAGGRMAGGFAHPPRPGRAKVRGERECCEVGCVG